MQIYKQLCIIEHKLSMVPKWEPPNQFLHVDSIPNFPLQELREATLKAIKWSKLACDRYVKTKATRLC